MIIAVNNKMLIKSLIGFGTRSYFLMTLFILNLKNC